MNLSAILVLVLVACLNFCSSFPFRNSSRTQLAAEPKQASLRWRQFQSFKLKYNRNYGSSCEEQERFQIFQQNLKTIERLNAEEKGTAVYGINDMADWTEEEFLTRRANLKPGEIAEHTKCMKKVNLTLPDEDEPIPDEFDWRSTHSITPVKNQGNCGSCWAFGSVANIEHMHAVKTGSLLDLSEQQLVDCSKKAAGCNGGTLTAAFETVIDMGGIVSESKYPYIAQQSPCKFNPVDVVVKAEKFVTVHPRDEAEMATFIANKGSTINPINAGPLMFYKSGVLVADAWKCSPAGINHLVSAVGYGRDSDSGLEFWAVKNSWGSSWGEEGYFRIARGKNTCGISEFIGSIVLKD